MGDSLGFIPGFDLSDLVYFILTNSGYKVDRQSVLKVKCRLGDRRLCYLVGKDALFATHDEFTLLGKERVGKVVAYINGPIKPSDIDELKTTMANVGSMEGWIISTRKVHPISQAYARALEIEVTDGDDLAKMLFDLDVLRPVSRGGQLCLRTPDGDECFIFRNKDVTVFLA